VTIFGICFWYWLSLVFAGKGAENGWVRMLGLSNSRILVVPF